MEILWEDDVLVAVNKSAALPVHATVDKTRPHLQGLLEKQLGKPLVLFHRLDVDTTGIVLFGKDPSINKAMTDVFRDRQAKKMYWAVVDGRWLESWDKVETFIKKISGGRWVNSRKGQGGDEALTEFSVLKSNGDRSWLEARPLTGRTHQIRLHCLEKGHPILGDRVYGRPDPKQVPIALHAREIEFLHPITRRAVKIIAEAPSYWKDHWLL